MMKNPALRQEGRYEPAPVIPLKQEGSLLDWLKTNNRIIFREDKIIEPQLHEDEEISELIEGDELEYDKDRDDELDDLD
jgi:hypothetical protein